MLDSPMPVMTAMVAARVSSSSSAAALMIASPTIRSIRSVAVDARAGSTPAKIATAIVEKGSPGQTTNRAPIRRSDSCQSLLAPSVSVSGAHSSCRVGAPPTTRFGP